MHNTAPLLLSFYALSNGKSVMAFGQLTRSSLRDFSFKAYTRRKTFRTILALYRTRLFANEEIELIFDGESIRTTTDSSGSFFITTDAISPTSKLKGIRLPTGDEVKIIEGLYTCNIDSVPGAVILISDIDDTLLHSHISKKLLKFRTLLFTSVENRKAVLEMRKVIQDFYQVGVQPFYLSNSEQNLYPVIYRFLINNEFPKGPMFLKQMRLLRNVFKKRDLLQRDVHKLTTLEKLVQFFPEKKFILIGDNTQNDLKIYSDTAVKFPGNIKLVIIRKVINLSKNDVITDSSEKLKKLGIPFFYDSSFPNGFDSISSIEKK